ncbi:LuxR C-terminal-related transcriptional regulator [Sediminivirga luteola]|nr:LuxR C-terminal-related transcriptional regulator [Sediminivirga luteola]
MAAPEVTGRDAERARLLNAIYATDPRNPAWCLIEGAPGSGKTTLLREASRRAAEAGFLVRELTALPGGGTPARRAATLLRDPRPLCLVADDLHTMKPEQSRLVAALLEAHRAGWPGSRAFLLLASAGPSPDETTMALRTHADAAGTRLVITGLPLASLARVLRDHGRPAEDEELEALHERSGGNPGLALAEIGLRSDPEPGIVAMLDGLAELQRAMVETLALARDRKTPCAVAEMASGLLGRPRPSTAEVEAIVEVLRPLLDGDGEDLRLASGRWREVIRSRMSDDRRVRLHQLMAERTSGLTRARHLVAAAGPGPDQALAADLEAQAHAALQDGDYAGACDHLLLAISVSARPDLPRRVAHASYLMAISERPAVIGELIPWIGVFGDSPMADFMRAGIAFFQGHLGEARRRLTVLLKRSASTVAPAAGDAVPAAHDTVPVADDGGTDGTDGTDGGHRATAPGSLNDQNTPAGPACEHSPDGADPLLRWRMLLLMAVVESADGDEPAAFRFTQEAMSLNVVPGNPVDAALDRVLTMQWAYALWGAGRLTEAFAVLDGFLRTDTGTAEHVDGRFLRGYARFYAGRTAEALADMRRAADAPRRFLAPAPLQRGTAEQAIVEFHTGRWGDAVLRAQSVLDMARASRDWRGVASSHAVLGMAAAAHADESGAVEHLDWLTHHMSTASLLPRVNAVSALAWVARLASDPEHVLDVIGRLSTSALVALTDTVGLVAWRALEIEALIDLGRTAEAERRLQEFSARLRTHPGAPLPHGHPAALRGALALARDDPAAARSAYEAAAGLSAEFPYAQARALHSLGRADRVLGDHPGADAALRRARDIFARLGAVPELTAVESRLLSVSGRYATLTPRERDFAYLISQGRTNRDIAAELFVSVKTVEYHVSNILTKLGLHSRRDLWTAAAVTAQRVTPPGPVSHPRARPARPAGPRSPQR